MTSSIDFLLDRDTDSVILLNLIKGSNLRLEICVCSVVSTVETSGAAGKWWDFYCIFCYAIRVSFFYLINKNPLLHKKITVGEYLQKKEASVKLYCDNCSFFRNTEDGKEAQQLQLMWQIWHKDVFGITVFYVMIQQIKKRGERQWI